MVFMALTKFQKRIGFYAVVALLFYFYHGWLHSYLTDNNTIGIYLAVVLFIYCVAQDKIEKAVGVEY